MTVVDLFAGGVAGWDSAASELGVRPVGIEHDAAACATRARNGHLTIRADVSQMALGSWWPRLEGLIASPPCPTFSAAGNRAGISELRHILDHIYRCVTGWRPYVSPMPDADPRSALVLEPLRFTLERVPQWIALEQVPDALPVWEAIAFVLRSHGWSVWCGVLNSADYGVPQTRKRAILMAHRSREVSPPPQTHCAGGASTLHGELAPWVTMEDALGFGGFDVVQTRGAGISNRHGSRPPRPCEAPAPTLTGSALGAGAGAKLKFAAREGGVLDRRTNSKDGRGGMVPTVTVSTDRPAPSLTGKGAAGQWVWRNGEASRNITIPEALALQSFRPDLPVEGTKGKRGEQIGNAIPPALARPILKVLV